MSRAAFTVSLALHAGALALFGDWAGSHATDHGPGRAEPTVSFLIESDAYAEPLVGVEQPAASPPEPEVAIFTQPVEPPVLVTPPPLPPQLTSVGPLAVAADISPPLEKVSAKREAAPARRKEIAPRRGANGNEGGAQIGGGSGGGQRGDYTPPRYRTRYKPPYPASARAEHLEGIVVVLVSVDPSGRVSRAAIQHGSGHPALDRAALDSVRTWRFDPATRNGVAVRAKVEVPVRFRFAD